MESLVIKDQRESEDQLEPEDLQVLPDFSADLV